MTEEIALPEKARRTVRVAIALDYGTNEVFWEDVPEEAVVKLKKSLEIISNEYQTLYGVKLWHSGIGWRCDWRFYALLTVLLPTAVDEQFFLDSLECHVGEDVWDNPTSYDGKERMTDLLGGLLYFAGEASAPILRIGAEPLRVTQSDLMGW